MGNAYLWGLPMLDIAPAIHPHMSDDEIACYRRHLARASSVVEFGVGGSTVLAAEIPVGTLHAIDSDPAWIDAVTKHPAVQRLIDDGRAFFFHANIGAVGAWGKPTDRDRPISCAEYARLPCSDPDLIFIDGRFRVACAMQALLSTGGDTVIAIHDFWPKRSQQWPARRYLAIWPFVRTIERAGTLGIFRRAPWFVKPLARLVLRRYRYDWR